MLTRREVIHLLTGLVTLLSLDGCSTRGGAVPPGSPLRIPPDPPFHLSDAVLPIRKIVYEYMPSHGQFLPVGVVYASTCQPQVNEQGILEWSDIC